MDAKTKELMVTCGSYDKHQAKCLAINCKGVAVNIDGRWFIRFGHAGFNSPANNRNGYSSKASATVASRHYGAKAVRAAAWMKR